jgi:serine/threonine-protein kinase
MPDPLPGRAADRNLLFGLTAMRLSFIGPGALVAAISAWVQAKDKPLSDILQAQGSLSDSQCGLVEAVVREDLEHHEGDAQKSLATTPPVGPLCTDLWRIDDPDLRASLAHVTDTASVNADFHLTPAPPTGTPSASSLRFRVLRPHARGGLGEVFVALDEELHREVALKEVQARHSSHPENRSRFVREAEVTGRLEHPGIVPVYGLGWYGDGRPFYAMRFVKGETLQEAIARFHHGPSPRPEPGARALALRHLLTRFVAVCNTVAYAHSKGVLHRDLKPANVLLGPYGETLVVDWGLAKVLGAHELGGGSGAPGKSAGAGVDSALTRAGHVMGTPAYMSPEQAGGKLDELGPACDIYSLGATLYQLLTGRAPFPDGDLVQVLEKVRRGAYLRPREVLRNVPPALEAVCLQAMALRPEERYTSAQELAGDVEHWLADEPVGAYREPWTLRARRWSRRHRAVVSAAVAAGLVLLCVVGSGWYWLEHNRAGREGEATRALIQATQLRAEARTAPAERSRGLLADALAAAQRADGLLAGGRSDPALRSRVQSLVEELREEEQDHRMLARLAEVRLSRMALREHRLDAAAAGRLYAEAFAAYGLDLAGLSDAEAAAQLQTRSIRADLAAALDEWAGLQADDSQRRRLLGLAAAADPDPERGQLREALARGDVETLKRLARSDRMADLPVATAALLGRALGRLKAPVEAEAVLRRAQREHPSDFWANNELAGFLLDERQPPDCPEAVRFLTAAVALNEQSAAAHMNLGVALSRAGRPGDAIIEYRKAIALQPDLAQPHCNLGGILGDLRRFPEAEAEYRRAIDHDPKLPQSHYGLGNVLKQMGRLSDAVGAYRAAIALAPRQAVYHFNLAQALQWNKQPEEAAAEYREAIACDPQFPEAYCGLGQLLGEQGHLRPAFDNLRRGHELGTKRPGWRYPSARWVAEMDRLVALEERLPRVLKGEARPADATEQLEFAAFCIKPYQRRHAAAVRFYTAAFAADPKLGENLRAWHRYNAACAAILAAAGRGMDGAPLDSAGRAALRKQALDWLRADLALWREMARSTRPADRALAQKYLRHWQTDPDLASVREPAELATLPEGERPIWKQLWQEAEVVRKMSEGP